MRNATRSYSATDGRITKCVTRAAGASDVAQAALVTCTLEQLLTHVNVLLRSQAGAASALQALKGARANNMQH